MNSMVHLAISLHWQLRMCFRLWTLRTVLSLGHVPDAELEVTISLKYTLYNDSEFLTLTLTLTTPCQWVTQQDVRGLNEIFNSPFVS